MNILSMPLRRSSARAANPDTGQCMRRLGYRRAQWGAALASPLARSWRLPARWLGTVFIVDHHDDQCYLDEYAGWSRRATMRWIENDLNARRRDMPDGSPDGEYYAATLDRFPKPPKATAYLFDPHQPIGWR
jgi:hypothetical protein